jgi:hypothetical protein
MVKSVIWLAAYVAIQLKQRRSYGDSCEIADSMAPNFDARSRLVRSLQTSHQSRIGSLSNSMVVNTQRTWRMQIGIDISQNVAGESCAIGTAT